MPKPRENVAKPKWKPKAEEEAKKKAEEEARVKAEQEAKLKAEEEAKAKDENPQKQLGKQLVDFHEKISWYRFKTTRQWRRV